MAKKSTFFKDFKDFISKGNILDMAVGVIIGGAFGKIVSSLVGDVISPLIALATGGASLSELFSVISTPDALKGTPVPLTATEAQALGFNIMKWGNFIQTIIDFIIIALCIFIFLRIIVKTKAKMNAKKDAEAAAKAKEEKAKADAAAKEAAERKLALEEATLKQEKLLEEIRDLLAKK